MAKIILADDLKDKIKSNYHIRNSKHPFSTWLVKAISLKNKTYYLYIEQTTNLVIAARFLDKDKFADTVYYTLSQLPFITSLQIKKLMTILKDFTYSHEKNVPNKSTSKYEQALNKLFSQEWAEIERVHENNEILEAVLLSAYLNQVVEIDDMSISTFFALELNKSLPILSQKPKNNTKYVDLKAHYTDPRSWEKFESLSLSSTPAQQLQTNNLKIIKQFKISPYFKEIYQTNHVFSALEAFLNTYLFKHEIRPLTANLADPVDFIELNTMMSDEVSPDIVYSLYDLFISFYKFLSHAGTIRKADSDKVARLVAETYQTYTGNDLNEMRKYIFEPGISKNKDLNKKSPNPQTYEIRAKLRDFKPSIWRRFKISSSASVATLQQAVILMFNGFLIGHMYDLYNPKTQQVYELPEFHDEDFGSTINATEAKISTLPLNQKLILTYDFGDNWEFEITINKVLDEKPPKHPKILSGKGYGIIEDIGGVSRLTDYYHNRISHEEREWYGDINLDEFEIDELNELLKEIK